MCLGPVVKTSCESMVPQVTYPMDSTTVETIDGDNGTSSDLTPFVPFGAAETVRTLRDDERDILLEQARPIRGAQGELIPRKQWIRVTAAGLQSSVRLRQLLESATADQQLLVAQIHTEALSIEAVARALEWQAATVAEQQHLLEHSSWQSISNIMHAAAWLGSASLLSLCEAKLCAALCLENAVQLARAAERCDTPKLRSRCFFLLKAFFCADDGLYRPGRADGKKASVPRVADRAIRYANTTISHAAWSPVLCAWEATSRRLCTAQPCYMLCTLTRERHPEQPSIYRLVSEHDGRVLLVARQRWPGEGDFYIFAPPGVASAAAIVGAATKTAPAAPAAADAVGEEQASDGSGSSSRRRASRSACAPAAAATAASTYDKAAVEAFVRSIRDAEPEALPEHSAAYRGCVTSAWMGLRFSVYDGGLRPEQARTTAFPFPVREEVASVAYATNLLKSRPHSLTMVVRDMSIEDVVEAEAEAVVAAAAQPPPPPTTTTLPPAPETVSAEPMAAAAAALAAPSAEAAAAEGAGGASGFYSSRRRRLKDSLANLADTTPGVHSCRNVMPEWDEALQAYTLPFYQRVVLPSKKNVHIVQPHAPDDIVLLFGKRAKVLPFERAHALSSHRLTSRAPPSHSQEHRRPHHHLLRRLLPPGLLPRGLRHGTHLVFWLGVRSRARLAALTTLAAALAALAALATLAALAAYGGRTHAHQIACDYGAHPCAGNAIAPLGVQFGPPCGVEAERGVPRWVPHATPYRSGATRPSAAWRVTRGERA